MRNYILASLLVVGLVCSCSTKTKIYSYDAIDLASELDITSKLDTLEDTVPGLDTLPEEDVVPDSAEEPERLLDYILDQGDDGKQCTGYAAGVDGKINSCYLNLSFNETRVLDVIFLEDKVGIPGITVTFSFEDEVEGMVLSAAEVVTDQDGVASVELTSGWVQESFTVKVMAPGQFVYPLYYQGDVVSDCVDQLTLTMSNTSGLTNVRYYVFSREDGACADLDPETLPTALKASPMLTPGQTMVLDTFEELVPEQPLAVTLLGIGYNAKGIPVKMGCNDQKSLTLGQCLKVALLARKLAPIYQGSFEVTNYLDLVTWQPAGGATALSELSKLLDMPVRKGIELACRVHAPELVEFCAMCFNNPNQPSMNDLSVAGEIIIGALGEPPCINPETCNGPSTQLKSLLKGVLLGSVLSLNQEPHATGVFPEESVVFSPDRAGVKWAGDCCVGIDCGAYLTFEQLGLEPVVGYPTGAKIPGFAQTNFLSFTVPVFPLELKSGMLLNQVVEKLVLPGMFCAEDNGGPVDAYEKLLYGALGDWGCLDDGTCCQSFAQQIAAEWGQSGWSSMFLQQTCEDLVHNGALAVRAIILALDQEEEPGLSLATKSTCALYDDSGLNQVTAIGRSTPTNKRCVWNAKFVTGGGEILTQMPFHGTRVEEQ